MERVLNKLVERLKECYGDRLVSVVLYGSAAVGDHHGRFSDINVLCVLTEVTSRELGEVSAVFNWWQRMGNPPPLLFGREELQRSTDVFPMEFTDIRERHRILYGADVVQDLAVDLRYYRAEVEHELRAKLLRLREKAASAMAARDALTGLMAESLSTFCVLFRHSLRLAGEEASFEKRVIVEQAAARFGIDAAPFRTLLDLREGKIKARAIQPAKLFSRYLEAINKVVESVDHLDKEGV